jgi:hypothetical protein
VPNVREEEGAWPQLKGSSLRIDWKSKEKKRDTFQQDITTFHKEETYLH